MRKRARVKPVTEVLKLYTTPRGLRAGASYAGGATGWPG
jgi:hypothetical protein